MGAPPFFTVNISFDNLRVARRGLVTLFIAALPAAAPISLLGCSECGCSLSSDWAAQGYTMMPGLQAGVRFEYYDNTDLRAGRHSVARGALSFPNDDEIQQQTLNRNEWLDLDYVVSPAWAISAQIPYYDRVHSTIAPGDTQVSGSRASGLGDVRVVGRYQNFSFTRGFSFQLGLKLPTGRFDQDFSSGPQAGELLDRGLQLGSGTTDVIAGASYFWRQGIHLGYFLQATASQPLAYRYDYM
ncbi:MAG: hypothetical protein JWM35_2729, partial [Verrucomicrobia bacterium]|nr:hypothetical protein [Verrucomicrobiota bacterium]